METAVLIITGGIFLVFFLFLAVRQRQKREYWKRCQKAARRIIQEEYLDGSIIKKEGNYSGERVLKTMVVLKVRGSREKGCIFDPEREIQIGRNLESCDVCLSDKAVSSHNSRIFVYQGQLCIQDMDSANGTSVKAPGRKKKYLWGTTDFLYDKSKIWVGNTCIEVRVFSCRVDRE